MQYPQTRYQDSLAVGINDTQLTLTCALTPPTRTQGILTIGRLQANTEDVFYTSIAGNTITISLRGLSQTALTPTSILANQKNHSANESLEITTHHNYDTDLLRKTEDDTLSGNITFTNDPLVPGLKDLNGKAIIDTPATANAVNELVVKNAATGNNVILTTAGTDPNINLELQAKGTAVVILKDGAETKTNAAPVLPVDIVNKKYVDDQIAIISTAPVALNERVTYGATVTAGQLIYEDTTDSCKWKPITSSASTWYERLAIAVDAGVNNDTNKLVLLQGIVSGLTFNNINPTFASALTGTDISVGATAATRVAAFVISNTSGAEAIVPGTGTIPAKQTGTPSGPMHIDLVLEQQESALNVPALYWDSSNNIIRGAIIASATIAQANFSGVYQNLAYNFGSNIKIPAGAKVYRCISKPGAADPANFYLVQSNAATALLDSSTQTWSGTANAGNATLDVTSTSPVGYAVKAYTGSNGSFGLTPTNPWSRVIGTVISSTEMYFNPEIKKDNDSNTAIDLYAAGFASGFKQVTTNFCPSRIDFTYITTVLATANLSSLFKGYIRGDSNNASTFQPNGWGGSSITSNFLGVVTGAGSGFVGNFGGGQSVLSLQYNGIAASGQNKIYCVRLENGFYLYNGYRSGTNYISAGNAGFTQLSTTFELKSKV